MYIQRGNIPAVVCLITAFIERCTLHIVSQNLLKDILNIFAQLVKLKNYDHEGFNILTVMLLYLPPHTIDNYLNSVYKVLMQRVQTARTPKYVRILIIFLSVAVIMRGAGDLVRQFDSLQGNLFMMLLDKV
uniref:Exportin-2 n=1 Tax=Lygus hesperus TaxID=30085 RepID=A0A0A9WKK9_LYGHE